jgi:hypothetical protein
MNEKSREIVEKFKQDVVDIAYGQSRDLGSRMSNAEIHNMIVSRISNLTCEALAKLMLENPEASESELKEILNGRSK